MNEITPTRMKGSVVLTFATLLGACAGADGAYTNEVDAAPPPHDTADSSLAIDTTIDDSQVAFDLGLYEKDAAPEAAADSKDTADTPDPPDVAEAPEETAPDTTPAETDPPDTDTDSGAPETDPPDTADTAPDIAPDTTIEDNAPEVFDTAPDTVDTSVSDSGTDTSVADTTLGPPTVHFVAPAMNVKLPFSKTSDTCQFKRFSVDFTAPAGLKSLQLKFITPNASKATTAMIGTCTGMPAYGYFFDPAKDPSKTGATSGSVSEDVSLAGLYGDTGGSRWWWCTAPGSSGTAFVLSPPAPGSSGVQTLSNYCYAKSPPPDSDTNSRWQVQAIIVDATGATATDTLYFWLHL